MISASIQGITKAEAVDLPSGTYSDACSVVRIYNEGRSINNTVTLFLPAGTADAVAAAINAAVRVGQIAELERANA